MPRWRFEHTLFALWCVTLLVGAELRSRSLALTALLRPRWHGFAPDSVLGYGHRPNYGGRIFYGSTLVVRTNHRDCTRPASFSRRDGDRAGAETLS